MKKILVGISVVLLAAGISQAGLTGSLSTPAASGLVSGGDTWSPANGDPDHEGFSLLWAISQNNDGSWHYKYTFKNEAGEALSMDVSHFIISLSQGCNIYNTSGKISEFEIGVFGPGPSDPEFPAGKSIDGVKFELEDATVVAEFDSDRMPMWGDFYAKDGAPEKNFVYNVDLGAAAANLHDYMADSALDASGNELFKVLVPNEIPEPATFALLGAGALLLNRRRRK